MFHTFDVDDILTSINVNVILYDVSSKHTRRWLKVNEEIMVRIESVITNHLFIAFIYGNTSIGKLVYIVHLCGCDGYSNRIN